MNFAFRYETGVSSPASASRLERVDVLRRLEDAERVWRALEEDGIVQSPYQRREWVTLWHSHVTSACQGSPLIVIGYGRHDEALFLWPLVLTALGPLTAATFMGGKHATLNLPSWRPDYADRMDPGELNQILDRIVQEAPEVDVLMLLNQPVVWNDMRNPLALLRHQRATENHYRLTLKSGPAPAETNISHGTRRRLRKKENHLARLPGYRYLRASTEAEVDRCLSAFFVQKSAHLAEVGFSNVFDKPGIKSFIGAACREGLSAGRPVIELHALMADGELLALFAGVNDGKRFTLAFNSMTRGPHARFSPGLVLLQHVITDCARRGFSAFDIGPGDVRYKTYFCKEYEPIVDSVLPLSSRGKLAAPLLLLALRVKGYVKRSPVLWPLVLDLKRRLHGRAVAST